MYASIILAKFFFSGVGVMGEVSFTSIFTTTITKAVQCAPLIAPYVNHVNADYLSSCDISYSGMEVSPHDNGYRSS